MEPRSKKDTEESKDYLLTRQETLIAVRVVAILGLAILAIISLQSPFQLKGGFIATCLLILAA